MSGEEPAGRGSRDQQGEGAGFESLNQQDFDKTADRGSRDRQEEGAGFESLNQPDKLNQQDQQRTLLEAEHARLQARADELQGNLDDLTRARRSESDDDEHDPEGETLSAQWSMLTGVLENVRVDLAQAADALVRLDAGTYGICTVCGNPIPHAQLEVRPFRESCVACASKR